MKTVTILIPCYNEELNILYAYQEISKVIKPIKKYRFKIIFIDNGSLDSSRKIIEKITRENNDVTGLFLSRNFGPESSTQAGIDYSKGDAVITLWCDLQDPPKLIPQFIQHWEEGSNIVIGLYNRAQDNFIITLLRKLFYKIYKSISNIDVPVNATGFGLMDKKTITAIRLLPEKYRFFRGLRSWIGFKTSYIKYDRDKRRYGKSSYNLYGYIKHSERGIFGFSYFILDFMSYLGFTLVLLSFTVIIYFALISFFFKASIQTSSIIVLAIIFFGGVQLLAISIIGKYIEVIVEETKNRPTYIVDKIVGNYSQLKQPHK